MLEGRFREIIKVRMELRPEDDYETEKCWKEEIMILSENIKETINFLDNDCTADEFSWISEVFDGIVEKTQSKEFIDCLYRVAKKYPEECEKYNILAFIEDAKDFLD